MNIKNNKGFSLIEVLVTVGLIGILVGIAVPSYNKYKKNTLRLAIKSDVGNGHKAYSAYDAIQGDFCATLTEVGMNVLMTSSTYRKKGAYGFGKINVDCGGTPSDVKTVSVKSDGYCQDNTNKQATGDTKTDCDAASTKTWQVANKFDGSLTACEIGADVFDLGAYSNVSDLNTFIMVNESGKVYQKSGDVCTIVP